MKRILHVEPQNEKLLIINISGPIDEEIYNIELDGNIVIDFDLPEPEYVPGKIANLYYNTDTATVNVEYVIDPNYVEGDCHDDDFHHA